MLVNDTLEGSTLLDLSEYPVNITDVTMSVKSGSTFIVGPESLDDRSSLYEVEAGSTSWYPEFSLNVTNYIDSIADGQTVWLNFTMTDAAGHSMEVTLSAVVDLTPPTIDFIGVYHDSSLTYSLYQDSTSGILLC